MTDLLDPPGSRTQRAEPPAARPVRSLAVSAAAAGLASSTVVLAACMALGLAAWFASDAGSHGSTRDALRVGADGWLLAQGADLHLLSGRSPTVVTVAPLGLTLLCAWAAFRSGRRAAGSAAVQDGRSLLLGVGVLAGVYGLVALVTAVLASTPGAEPAPAGALAGGLLLSAVAGGGGLLVGSDAAAGWSERVPEPVRAVAVGAVSTVLALVVAASVLLAVALLLDLGSAANVLSRLHADVSAGLLTTVLVAAVAPNAVLLTGSYLLGPGFAVGTGTVVSPAVVSLGPVPAFPLLAALPQDGPQPGWLSALAVTPVVASVVGVALMLRRYPVPGYAAAALRGVGAGIGGALLLTVLVSLAGGAVGPGRMADVGAGLLDTLGSASVSMGLGGLFAGVAVSALTRRRSGDGDGR